MKAFAWIVLVVAAYDPPPAKLVEQVRLAMELYSTVPVVLEALDDRDFFRWRSWEDRRLNDKDGCPHPIELSRIDTFSFPNEKYVLYHLEYNWDKLFCSGLWIYRIPREGVTVGIVGYNEEDETVEYISGPFYKHRIAHHFNMNDEKERERFVRFKVYDCQIKNLRFEKENWRYVYYVCFSKKYGRNIKLKISKKDYDVIEII